MPKLVNLDEGEDKHGVHEGGVKLQASIVGEEGKDATANSLQKRANSMCVKYDVLLVRTKY